MVLGAAAHKEEQGLVVGGCQGATENPSTKGRLKDLSPALPFHTPANTLLPEQSLKSKPVFPLFLSPYNVPSLPKWSTSVALNQGQQTLQFQAAFGRSTACFGCHDLKGEACYCHLVAEVRDATKSCYRQSSKQPAQKSVGAKSQKH